MQPSACLIDSKVTVVVVVVMHVASLRVLPLHEHLVSTGVAIAFRKTALVQIIFYHKPGGRRYMVGGAHQSPRHHHTAELVEALQVTSSHRRFTIVTD